MSDWHPPEDFSAAVQKMLDRGLAVAVQANVKAGYIHYDFLGGVYDGYRLRLYPPFSMELTFHGDTYEWGPPKNGRSKRLTYRLKE